MPSRRNALKTLAGATVVGSLSGCVQLATQETTHFRGTPAMISLERPYQGMDDFFALGVGVEARRTVERAGITREIVAHSWGMLYSFVSINNTESTTQPLSVMKARSNIATFTTPSIQIAGQELNPITDLTVGDIAKEFMSITELESNVPRVVAAETDRSIIFAEVNDATGKNVLRAFRDAVGAPSTEYQPPSLDASASGGTLSTVPDWDGGTHELLWQTGSGDAGSYPTSIRFEKHDGDFVVVFEGRPDNSDSTFVTPDLGFENATALRRSDTGGSGGVVHPTDEHFSREVLQRHLLDTNLFGARGLVRQGRELIDETQELLEAVNPPEDQRQREKFHSVVSDTQDDLQQIDELLSGVEEGLSSLSLDTLTGGRGDDTLLGISKGTEKAAEIAKQAHERVASHNDTRDEEDERFVRIDRQLDSLRWVSRTITRVVANGRKTVKARDA